MKTTKAIRTGQLPKNLAYDSTVVIFYYLLYALYIKFYNLTRLSFMNLYRYFIYIYIYIYIYIIHIYILYI